MSYKNAFVSIMVAGTWAGSDRGSQVPKFDDADFDRRLIFLKAFLKIDRADVSFIEPMPSRDMDEDSVEYLFQNISSFSYVVEACISHSTARLVFKSYSGTMAAVL